MRTIAKYFMIVVVVWAVGYAGVLWLMKPTPYPSLSYAHPAAQCFSHEGDYPWRHCIFRAQDVSATEYLYYLHGRDLDEKAWDDDAYYTGQIQKYWQEHHRKAPTVITVSFGDVWLLADRNAAARSGLFEYFTGTVLPEIEKPIGAPKRRMLLGESMGGVNGLLLALKTKGVFERVASLCPPIATVSPFDDWRARWKFIHDSGADPRTMLGVMILARMYASTEADWKRISPLDLVESADPKSAPRLYLSAGLRDKYGSFPSVQKLAARAAERGFPLEWRPLFAGHCGIDLPSVADFLTP